ncbi:hypothetical protein A2U01_0107560, partial [Trifolium medium]|nr:hypothetical protein [Trifolium medium]
MPHDTSYLIIGDTAPYQTILPHLEQIRFIPKVVSGIPEELLLLPIVILRNQTTSFEVGHVAKP